MKSKNIPADIRSKSIKEAQSEIKDIIEKLESPEISLENSRDQYDRMMQLNFHIQSIFKQKAEEIKKPTFVEKKTVNKNKIVK
ncbi:MAG: Exonuclease VII small subunit [Pelagibacterales bacterium]|nr:Exonuclease VII small subunit [Pelagibacterales bacterium]